MLFSEIMDSLHSQSGCCKAGKTLLMSRPLTEILQSHAPAIKVLTHGTDGQGPNVSKAMPAAEMPALVHAILCALLQ